MEIRTHMLEVTTLSTETQPVPKWYFLIEGSLVKKLLVEIV